MAVATRYPDVGVKSDSGWIRGPESGLTAGMALGFYWELTAVYTDTMRGNIYWEIRQEHVSKTHYNQVYGSNGNNMWAGSSVDSYQERWRLPGTINGVTQWFAGPNASGMSGLNTNPVLASGNITVAYDENGNASFDVGGTFWWYGNNSNNYQYEFPANHTSARWTFNLATKEFNSKAYRGTSANVWTKDRYAYKTTDRGSSWVKCNLYKTTNYGSTWTKIQ
ncbi:MAG: hypothetical protein J6T15_05165 [Bacilli bacterium]|nr:hypothetical protein [Bacilli bacterium]